jgi:5-methylcytosine-specific restriction endonuclease McrA
MIAPPRTCSSGGCHHVVTGSDPRCQAHRRPPSSRRGYGGTWTAYAHDWLRRFPWCGQRVDGTRSGEHSWCFRRGIETRAQVVDHIVAIALGGARLDPANHQSLCVACNTRKKG